MPDISLQRKHRLGLERAREVAWQWAEQAEQKFGMQCTVEKGDCEDTVHFTRSGVAGTLRVSADGFDIDAKLGLLLGAFQPKIEAEIEKNLDTLLAAEGPRGRAVVQKQPPAKAPDKPHKKASKKA